MVVRLANSGLLGCLGRGTEQKITTKPVGVDARGDPKTMEFDLFYGYMQTNSLKKFINFKIIKSFVSGRRGVGPYGFARNLHLVPLPQHTDKSKFDGGRMISSPTGHGTTHR